MRRFLVFAIVLLFVCPFARGIAFMIPTDQRWAPLELDSHRVTVDIEEQTARTKVVQVFRNQHSAQLEATLVFPLPKNAAISDFKMYVNGRLVTGEIMEAGQARQVYEDIVRRSRDPGLLEYMDSRLFRLRVFPIPPGTSQEVQITYEQSLVAQGGLVEYVYPLKTPENYAQTIHDFTLTANISSAAGVKNVYSPTHEIYVRNSDDKHAVAGFEKMAAALDRDFQLFYEITNKEFGASLLSTKPSGKDGFFMLLVSPKVDFAASEIMPKDVAFVLDTSGSMAGPKLDQAKKALLYCVNALNASDRFNVIAFNIGIEKFRDSLADANPDNRKNASGFIDKLQASGGTNISEALAAALSQNRDKARPYVIVFLTDGVATVGDTSPDRIMDNVRKRNEAGVRIFSFGVGYDVNAVFLDQLSEETKAATEYVEPQENIETKVSAFFQRIGDPILADVKLNFTNAEVYDVFPPNAGDVFRGGQLVVTGRYRNPCASTAVLKGKGPKGELVFEYPVEFVSGSGRGDFVQNVWAGRKIAYLLGQIRLHGETGELKDEVVRLSREFGIVTPYTSYLVTEGSPIVRRLPPPVVPRPFPHPRRWDMPYPSAGPASVGSAGGGVGGRIDEREYKMQDRSTTLNLPTSSEKMALQSAATAVPVGKDAVAASRSYQTLVTSAVADKGHIMRAASGRTFYNIDGVWIDDSVKSDQKVISIKFGSSEYFDIVAKAPALKDAFALGDKLVMSVGKWCIAIGDEQTLTADSADLKALMKALSDLK